MALVVFPSQLFIILPYYYRLYDIIRTKLGSGLQWYKLPIKFREPFQELLRGAYIHRAHINSFLFLKRKQGSRYTCYEANIYSATRRIDDYTGKWLTKSLKQESSDI
jgi:hypothetical protein